MFAEMTELTVNDPFTVIVVIYFMATVVLVATLLDLRKIIWNIYPTIKGYVKGFRFDGPASGYDGELYTVAVDYEVNGVMHSKDVDYTEVIVSNGVPKYLPGEIIEIKRSPISGKVRTVEAVKYDTRYAWRTVAFTIIGIALLIGAIKFHLFANENFDENNKAFVDKDTIQSIIYLVFGIGFVFPSGLLLVTEIVRLVYLLRIKNGMNSGKYVPITTDMSGYSVRRKRSSNKKGHFRFLYFPYYKYQINNETRLVASRVPKYRIDISLIGKKVTCFKDNDTNKVLGYKKDNIPIGATVLQIVVYAISLGFILFIMGRITI